MTERAEPFNAIAQDPADILLLTAADTEVLTWSAAVAQLPAGFPSVRALNLDRLRDRRVFDAYLDDVLQESRVLVVRVLGGLGYWREQLEQIRLLAPLTRLPSSACRATPSPMPQLGGACTVPLAVADRVFRYCVEGGVDNAVAMLRYLSDTLLGTAFGYEPPRPLPEVGIYHPDHAGVLDAGNLAAAHLRARPRRPLGIVFYRAHWVTGNLAPVDALIRALEARGLNVLAGFGPNLRSRSRRTSLLPAGIIDVLITTTSFSGTGLAAVWQDGTLAGRSGPASDLLLQQRKRLGGQHCRAVAARHRHERRPAGVRRPDHHHGGFLQEHAGPRPALADRGHPLPAAAGPGRTRGRSGCATGPGFAAPANGDKRVAILLANYPSKNARVGNAVGLDTPASLHALLAGPANGRL